MAEIYIRDKKIHSFFRLLGEKENNISYSVGWVLAKSPSFLRQFLRKSINWKKSFDSQMVQIKLQEYEHKKGFTDFEIKLEGEFHLIIEAKKGWHLPGRKQLKKYASRKSFRNSTARLKRIIILTDCTEDYARTNFSARKIRGIKVFKMSWRDIYGMSTRAVVNGSHFEKRLLKELNEYLERTVSMQKIDSNWVYVVSLGKGTPRGCKLSWIDIVTQKQVYLHTIGNGWPKEPPNYIAFRYHGKLQTIHHIKKYEVFTNPHKIVREIPNTDWGACYVYRLGKGFSPTREVRTGNLFKNGKVWCMLDTLFTSSTIARASTTSKKREKANKS